jgi:hypothetical protein
VPAERSFKKVVRQAFLSGLFLNATALIQVLRHRLRYYHLAVVEQLVILSIVPLNCALIKPGWHAFRLFEKIVTIASALFAMGWSIYLHILRPYAKSLEVECRNMWIQMGLEIQTAKGKIPERVLRARSLDPDMVEAFYVYQIFVNALTLTLSMLVLGLLALSWLRDHRRFGRNGALVWFSILLGFGTSLLHQYNVVKHFQHYTDNSENDWGFGQIYPLLAILLPIGDFASDMTYEEFWQWLPLSMIPPLANMNREANQLFRTEHEQRGNEQRCNS